MGAFVEKYLTGNWRHRLFRRMSSTSVFDIPTELHTLKSESIEQINADRFEVADNFVSGSILMENGDEIRLEKGTGIIVKEN